MKRLLLAAALLALGATAHAQKARIVTCTTAGDALGGLKVFFAKANLVVLEESTMEGKTVRFYASAAPEDFAAWKAGRSVTFVSYTSKANIFGGAVTPATLFTMTGAKGYLARKGIVYYLGCKG